MKKQIKSKQRVTDFGEVYTNEREVQAMLDLVEEEASNIKSRFLEPSCGDGNFLDAILKRKLKTISVTQDLTMKELEILVFWAVSSLYGIDIQEDNITESRERLLEAVQTFPNELLGQVFSYTYLKSIKYVISKNIVCGDSLTGLNRNQEPLVFSEWRLENDNVKRRDYLMEDLLNSTDSEPPYIEFPSISLSRLGEAKEEVLL